MHKEFDVLNKLPEDWAGGEGDKSEISVLYGLQIQVLWYYDDTHCMVIISRAVAFCMHASPRGKALF
jgi:hypothetical protein